MGDFYISSVYNNNVDYEILSQAVKLSKGEVGVEFFALELNQDKISLFKDIKKNLELTLGKDSDTRLKATFHSPMVNAEATACENSVEQKNLFDNWEKSLKSCEELGAKHIVFHTNNRKINEDERIICRENCKRNCIVLNDMCRKFGVTLLVESLGLPCTGATVFTEKEYIDFIIENDLSALIDVGHMNLNGYDYENVLSSLGDKIKAYHIHNNDGNSDSHDVFTRGTFDYSVFAKCYKKYTPNADFVMEYIDVSDLTADKFLQDIDSLKKMTK